MSPARSLPELVSERIGWMAGLDLVKPGHDELKCCAVCMTGESLAYPALNIVIPAKAGTSWISAGGRC